MPGNIKQLQELEEQMKKMREQMRMMVDAYEQQANKKGNTKGIITPKTENYKGH